jgi:hypothetical protein
VLRYIRDCSCEFWVNVLCLTVLRETARLQSLTRSFNIAQDSRLRFPFANAAFDLQSVENQLLRL